MPRDSSERIAPTGHYTAYAWHVLGLPYADWFATPLGARLHRAYAVAELPQRLFGGGSRLTRTLDNRHRSIDAELLRARPDRIVELGAGLSRRGVTWALDHATDYVELDLPAMVSYKRQRVDACASPDQRARLAEHWTLREEDILDPGFAKVLAGILQGATRPTVIMEGVLGYFDRPLQHQLLRAIHQALAGRGRLLVDLRIRNGRPARMGLLRTAILVATRGRGAAPSLANEAEARALFREAGFGDVEVLPPLQPDVLSCVVRARP